MNDEPSAPDLLRAVERFLERDAVAGLDGVARFHARVAANVVAMVAREIETEAEHARREWEGLAALLGEEGALPETPALRREALARRNEALCERIRAGEADTGAMRGALLAHLRGTVADKLEVSFPPRERDAGKTGRA